MNGLAGPEHGGISASELEMLGIPPDSVADFSVNTNPYGPDPRVLAAIREARLDRYPDPDALAARRALGTAVGCTFDHIALANGAADLLWALARALVRPGQGALIVEPTFSEFRRAVHASGGVVHEWRARAEDGFAMQLGEIAERLVETGSVALYLCSPNTPTGIALDVEQVVRLARHFPNVWIVLDQSFLSLSDHAADESVPLPRNVIRVRSLTKDHAVPGVRVGYAIASSEVIAALDAGRPAWSSSALAQAVASAAAGARDFVAVSAARWLAARSALSARLAEAGFRVHPSSTGFFLMQVAHAGRLRARLLERHRVLVRDCASFGLPDFVRIAARRDFDNQRLLAALKEERSFA